MQRAHINAANALDRVFEAVGVEVTVLGLTIVKFGSSLRRWAYFRRAERTILWGTGEGEPTGIIHADGEEDP